MAIDPNLTPVEVLKLALEKERQAYEFYKEAAERCVHHGAKATFLALAEEEKGHIHKIEEDLDRDFFKDN